MNMQHRAALAMIAVAIFLAFFFRFKEHRPPDITTEEQVREENRRLDAQAAESADAGEQLREAVFDAQTKACEHLISGPPREYAECIGVPVLEWCEQSEYDRAQFRRMGVKGRDCP